MLTCPRCHAGIPEGMRFCLQCGASLAPPPLPGAPPLGANHEGPAATVVPPAPLPAPAPSVPVTVSPRPQYKTLPTVNLKIAPTPVISRAAPEHPRPSLGDQRMVIDDEALMKAFARPVAPGVVVCRFCKRPLDLDGDFCDQCGAPVAEAAPPGALKPKPAPPADLTPPPGRPAQAATPAPLPAATPPPQPRADIISSARPAELTEPLDPTPKPMPTAEERPSGFMGRLRGLFKKG
jgi:RNA polymerase subunit RPABC4/transcription elongation factor Spt4